MSVSLTRHITNPARTTNYGGDGTGRDTYIYMSNGGFVPQKMATQVEEIGKFITHEVIVVLGSFVTVKQRPRDAVPHIHSKPVCYTNNGGGRDTYISMNSGGLKVIHQPAYFKRTFYTNLRQYPEIDNYGRRGKSHTATVEERTDVFSRS